MQGSRNIDILMHIRDYCVEINHTMDTFGRDYDVLEQECNEGPTMSL